MSKLSPSHLLSRFSDATDDVDGAGSSDGQPPLLPPPQVPACEEGRDLLTCGQCSQAFPLAHILAFIQHKQGGCRSRNLATIANTTPHSPANRAQQSVTNSDLGPGYIELRRGAARDRAWGDEPGVKGELSKTGEHMEKEAE